MTRPEDRPDGPPVVVFGTGPFAEVVDAYLRRDGFEVAAFTATGEAGEARTHLGRPVVPWEGLADTHSPAAHRLFVAVGYTKLNRVREAFCADARARGYHLLSYLSPRANVWPDLEIGDNVFVFEDNTIQPFVSIGPGTILWSGNHIGHHSRIGAYCFISSHVVVSGHCTVGDRSFLGVNATLADGVALGAETLLGPGAIVQKSTDDGGVYFGARSERFGRPSASFFR